MGKSFKELDLSNAFLFAATLSDSQTCQLVLEIILGQKLPSIEVNTEHTILVSSEFKSVRLDVYGTDELRVNYNIEAQNDNENNLAKRSRFHQAEMDVKALKPGEKFEDLRPAYVIFICTFDPFGKGLYRYTFENRCEECDIPLGDGVKKIFLSTKGRNDDEVPKELIHFLKYVEHSTDDYVANVNDANISRLHESVTRVKLLQDLEEKFMTGQELLDISHRKGVAEGISQGLINGKIESIIEFLSELGTLSEELETAIKSEKDLDILKGWVKLAARVSSVEEFADKMNG